MNLHHPAFRASWLTLVAGLSDGLGWLQTGLFAAQMTGNTALLGIDLASGHWRGAAEKAAAIFCFLAGGLAVGLLSGAERHRRRNRVTATLAASLVILLAAFLPRPVNVLILSAALGAQNAAFSRIGGQGFNTSFISGDLQKLAKAVAGRIVGRDTSQDERTVLVAIPSLWLGYVAGAAIGVACQHDLARPLLIPALMLPLVLLLPDDDTRT